MVLGLLLFFSSLVSLPGFASPQTDAITGACYRFGRYGSSSSNGMCQCLALRIASSPLFSDELKAHLAKEFRNLTSPPPVAKEFGRLVGECTMQVYNVGPASSLPPKPAVDDFSARWTREAHPEWYSCGSDRECAVATGVCRTPTAARRDQLAEVETHWKQTPCDHPASENSAKTLTTVCWAGECYLHGTEPVTAHEDWFRCDSDKDCVIGAGPCLRREAVNQKYLTLHDRWRREEESARKCSHVDDKQPLAPVCRGHRCAAVRRVGSHSSSR